MKHVKIVTTIYVRQEIKDFCKKHKIALSTWVNENFSKQYLELESKINRLQEISEEQDNLEGEQARLKQEISIAKKLQEELTSKLTVKEIERLKQVKKRARVGYDVQAMRRSFNADFTHEYTEGDFDAILQRIK